MDPARKDYSHSIIFNRLQDNVVKQAIIIGLPDKSINQLRVLCGSKKKGSEVTIKDFVQENYIILDQIFAIFQQAQFSLLSDFSIENAKCTKILCNLSDLIAKEAERISGTLSPTFQDEVEKNRMILKVMKKLNNLNSEEQLQTIVYAGRDGSVVGSYFIEFLNQYPEILGKNNNLTLAFKIFRMRSLQDCYSLNSKVAQNQILNMQKILSDQKSFVATIAKRSLRTEIKASKEVFNIEKLLKMEGFDRQTAELFENVFGEMSFKDLKAMALMLDLIEKGHLKFIQVIDSQSFWMICQKAVLKSNLRPSAIIENPRLKGDIIQNENAIKNLIWWGVLHMPKTSHSLEYELLCLEWALSKIIFSDTYKFPESLIQGLIDQRLLDALPLFSLNKSDSIYSVLLIHPNIPDNIKLYMLTIDKEILESCHFFISFFNMNFIEQNLNLLGVEKHLQILREKKYPYLIWVENEIDKFYQKRMSFPARIQEIKEKKLKLKTDEYEELKKYALVQNDSDLIIWLETRQIFSSELDEEQKANTVIYDLMLDKLANHELGNVFTRKPTKIFAQALIDTLERLTKNKEKMHLDLILPFIRPMKNHFIPLLKQLIVLEVLYDSCIETCGKYIVKQLNEMRVADKMLIPIGCQGHAAGLLVTKTDEELFEFTIYNTGSGVIVWHPRWLNTNKYQTFLTINNIPSLKLMMLNSWFDLIAYRKEAKNMDPVYKLLFNSFGKGGKQEKSSYEADYEAKQLEGTCAMQFQMALLRHQFMLIVPGTHEEKVAAYKILKANMFYRYFTDNTKLVDSKVKEYSLPVFQKIFAEMEMVIIAKSVTKFNLFMSKMELMFVELGAQETFQTLLQRNSKTTLMRYAITRAASITLCMIWLKKNTPLIQDPKILMLAVAKYEHQQIIRTNLEKRFHLVCQEKLDIACIATLVVTTETSTVHPEMGLEYALVFFKDKDFREIQQFLDILKKVGVQMAGFVQKFSDNIKSNGNELLADQINKYWIEIMVEG